MMTSASIPLSGMKFAQANLRSTAHNTANLETDGFSRQRSLGSEGPTNGAVARVDTVSLTPDEAQLADRLPGAQNNVSQIESAVNRIAAVRSFEANARVVRTQDQLSRNLLDLSA